MSAQAVQILFFWATKNSREIQRKFVAYYNQKRSAYQHGAVSSGEFDFGDRLITSDGIKQMIAAFEEHNGFSQTNLDRTP